MCNLNRNEKAAIRKRDAKRIKLTGTCVLCGSDSEPTSRHHLYYDKEKFVRAAVIEVCDTCDCKIHKRDNNDNWVRELRAVRAIRLIRNGEYPDRYDIMVDDKKVGCAYSTLTGIKLVITD